MKKLITLIVIVAASTTTILGQCTSLFSFAAYFNTVNFLNQSTVSNAHYFWNFGDGTGSNFANPIHTFPDNGEYMVTLFAKDTVSNCSSYYEYRVNVTKYSADPCQPRISDSIPLGSNDLYIYDSSTNCNGYQSIISAANFANFSGPIENDLSGWPHFHIVCIELYYDSAWIFKREAYKTAYYNYSSSHNYGDCSANFEFTVVSQNSSGERILFKAMNKTATSYKFYISGFGNPIYSTYDTISQFYPYSPNLSWQVGLYTQGSTGCYDTIYQNIVVTDSAKTISTDLGVTNLIATNGAINVYPNPNNGKFTLTCHSEQGEESLATIQVYNMLGEKVYNETLKQVQGDNSIDISNQPNGIYLYRVVSENGNLLGEGKVIVQK
jgi:PKD repeat protein